MRCLSVSAAAVLAVAVGGPRQPSGKTSHPARRATSGTPQAPRCAQAPVVIDGEVLFTVRGDLRVSGGKTGGRDRAQHSERWRGDAGAGVPSLTLEEQPHGDMDSRERPALLPVYDEDAAVEAVDRRLLAEAYRLKIAQAITAYRERQAASASCGGTPS